MNKQFLKYSAAVALLLDSSSAQLGSVTPTPYGLGGPAPCIESWTGIWSGPQTGFDVHSTHGFEAKKDKALVTVGSAPPQAPDGTVDHSTMQGLIWKMDRSCKPDKKYTQQAVNGDPSKCEKLLWQTTISIKGEALKPIQIAESPDGSYYAVVGFKQSQDKLPDGYRGAYNQYTANQAIWKVDAQTGEVLWMNEFSSSPEGTDALETLAFAPDGGLIVGGYVGKGMSSVWGQEFKSGGQAHEGFPFIAKISAAGMGGSEAGEYEWFWHMQGISADKSDPMSGSAKAIRIDEKGDIYSLYGKYSSVIKLDQQGNVLADSGMVDKYFQGTDLEIAPDGGVVMSGHQHDPGNAYTDALGAIAGAAGKKTTEVHAGILKVDKDLKKSWFKTYGNFPGGINQYAGIPSGPREYIFDECFGITTTRDKSGATTGYVMACAIGIEGCEGRPAECENDPRVAWRATPMATDLNGDLVWYRMDSYQNEDSLEGQKVATSSCEFVFPMEGGKFACIIDEAGGQGVLVYNAADGDVCQDPMNADEGPSYLAQLTQPSFSQMSVPMSHRRGFAQQKSIKDLFSEEMKSKDKSKKKNKLSLKREELSKDEEDEE